MSSASEIVANLMSACGEVHVLATSRQALGCDGEVIRRYRPEEMRLLVHWNAEVYSDMDEVKKSMDHSDDLTHDVVFARLLADMRAKGVKVDEPSDPMHDQPFIRALIDTYSIAPATDWAQPATV